MSVTRHDDPRSRSVKKSEGDGERRTNALVEAAIARLCDQLDAASETDAEASARVKRKDRRYSYRKNDLVGTVDHPSGGSTKLKIFTRNLSCGGLAFLHTNFVYTGSSCTVQLTRKDGEVVVASGPIVKCRHVHGPWHESSMRFTKRLDPLLFVVDKAAGLGGDGSGADLDALAGRVLYVDDSKLDHRLMAHFIRGSQIALQCVTTEDEVLAAVRANSFDILISDLNLEGRDGLEIVRKAREAGFCGPVMIVTAENRGDRLARCKAAGVSQVLNKPYQQRTLLQLLAKMHEQVGAVVSSEILYSSIEEEPHTQGLIAGYVEEAKSLAARLQTAIAAGDVPTAREICLGFKGSAGSYGFIPLQVAAEAAVTALDSSMSIEESRAPLRKVELTCGRLGLRSNTDPLQKMNG